MNFLWYVVGAVGIFLLIAWVQSTLPANVSFVNIMIGLGAVTIMVVGLMLVQTHSTA